MNEPLWPRRPRPSLGSDAVRLGSWVPTKPADLTASRRQLSAALHNGARPAGAAEPAVERLLLAYEELVSNALRHGAFPVEARVTADGRSWLLEVADGDAQTPPTPDTDRDPAFGGLGLHLVAEISDAHGWTEEDRRKVVWARIDFAPAAAADGDVVPLQPEPRGEQRPAAPAAAPARRRRRAPSRISLVVAALLLAMTAVLTVLAWQVNQRSEQRLLARQLAQVGTLLTNQGAVQRTELADIAQVAVNTNANPAAFARFAGPELTQTGQSLSLWRVSGGQPQQLALQGVDPWLPAQGPAAFTPIQPTGQLQVLGILPGRDGKPDRLATALMPPSPDTDVLVYAESPLPPGHRMPATAESPVAGLDLALYLGTGPDPARLLAATAPTPISGRTQRLTVPFGAAEVTVVGASPTRLTGSLSAMLPWIVLGVGLVLSGTGVVTLETVSRRRAEAERLAAENAELYRRQRGIAGTLQQALLPGRPDVTGVEVAARYLPGVDALDVGGDWYDVVERRPGCIVFVVGDVSGHGLPAATTMAALRFAVRGFISEGHDVVTILALLRGLLDLDSDHQFATVLLGELDAGAGRLRLVSAGHLPPLLVTAEGARLVDCTPAPPVGVAAAGPPVLTELRLSGPGTLIAYTDGLVERRGEILDAGLERLRDAGAAFGRRSLESMLDDLQASLIKPGGRKDDTVILGLRW
jgi:serine phosphatase RsbU (regulator of sigma subunit)/anti-sigma regulatory factor (Ser/Thr protein kinase)